MRRYIEVAAVTFTLATTLAVLHGCTTTRPARSSAAVGRIHDTQPSRNVTSEVAKLPRRAPAPLTAAEMSLARTAWKYFENNYQPATGFVNAVDKFPSTTLWDLGSTLAATVSALELGLITRDEFDKRIRPALASLAALQLFRKELPNKVYNAVTLAPSTYANEVGEIGYSAIDIGRLLTWLRIVRERYPQYADPIDAVVLKWNFCRVLDQWGTMFGAAVSGSGATQYLQEGRLGYEEYAAKGFELWGFDTTRAAKPEPFEYQRIYDYQIPYDKRDPRELGAHNYVVSESYVLDGLEFNWDLASDVTSRDDLHTDPFLAAHADRIFLVQKARHRQTGILTARTEHQLAEAPFFVYDTIYTDGFAWNTITEPGEVVPRFAAVAAKAALGLWALWSDSYADLLLASVVKLADPQRGILEGQFEDNRGPIQTFTANNNGIILETLLYRQSGKLLPSTRRPGRWDEALRTGETTMCRPRVHSASGRSRSVH